MTRYTRVSRNQGTRCTIEFDTGRFCDAPSAPGSPFPICTNHAVALYKWMNGMVSEVMENHQQYPDIHNAVVDHVADEGYARANTVAHRVYYIRCGDLVKIGTTRHLAARMHAYPPDAELLAVERGGEALEISRHHQFGHLLAHRKEWFHPAAGASSYPGCASLGKHRTPRAKDPHRASGNGSIPLTPAAPRQHGGGAGA